MGGYQAPGLVGNDASVYYPNSFDPQDGAYWPVYGGLRPLIGAVKNRGFLKNEKDGSSLEMAYDLVMK